jgi:hypothetical protein
MKWCDPPIRGLNALGALMLGAALAMAALPARAEGPLLTFGELLRVQALAEGGVLSPEEMVLAQNVEFYIYTVFETLEMANGAALLGRDAPLFCAPEGRFRFREAADLTGLAALVSEEVLALGAEAGVSLERYADQPASAVLLIGLRAVFPCTELPATLAQR